MFNKINVFKNRLNASKDGKAVASNFSYLMIMQVSGYIFPLLTLPHLARVIGVEGFGKIAFAAAIIVWFQTLTDWGFSYTGTRDVARNRENLEKISEIYTNIFWSKIALSLLSIIGIFIASELIPYLKENQLIIFATFLIVPAKILFADWIFQAMEKMKFITIFDFFSKLIFTILIILFVKEKQDFILPPLFTSLGTFIVGIVSFFIIKDYFNIKIYHPNIKEIIFTIKKSADIFINNIFPNLYNSFSSILLGFWGGSHANGLFDAGNKFANIAQQFNNIIARAFFPFLSRKINKHQVYVKINIISSVILSLLIFLLAEYIIKFFFTESFYEAVIVLKIMSISTIFLTLNNIYGVNYMIIKGYERELRKITVLVSLAGFLICFPLIYFYGYIGAAITIAVTRLLLGISVMFKAKNIERSIS